MEVEYYKLDDKELFETLKVDTNGLTGEEAKKRLEIYGSNVIKEKKKRSLILRFIDNFIHLFAIILWIAAGLCFIPRVNMPQLGYAIILVIVINAIFSFMQEYKAEKALESLKKFLPSYSTVLRGGEVIEIQSM